MANLAKEYRRRELRAERISCLWKAFILSPRLLLHAVGKWGLQGREVLEERIALWDAGRFHELMESSRQRAARRSPQAGRNTRSSPLEQAEKLVTEGQLSKAASMLTSNGIAPGRAGTLAQLRDPVQRPPSPL